MLTKNNKTFFFIICILFFSILFAKLYAIFSPSLLGKIDLAIDEAQYIFWSKSLETGYFSKPPFIAWVLSPLNQACGENYQCYRSLQPFAFFLSSIFCGLSTFKLTNNVKASCLSAFLFLTLPLSTFYSQFATTDAWLLLLWSTSTFFFIMTFRNGSFSWLLCCAVAVGIGLLTKYSMIFFCISALFLLLRLNQFSWVQIITATTIALLIFCPNIIWNITHDFPTLKHHVEMTSLDEGAEVQISPLI
ncbi:MAG: glycosyltransferase family 39 protein, partial [Burkholderiaceae bacterium]